MAEKMGIPVGTFYRIAIKKVLADAERSGNQASPMAAETKGRHADA